MFITIVEIHNREQIKLNDIKLLILIFSVEKKIIKKKEIVYNI